MNEKVKIIVVDDEIHNLKLFEIIYGDQFHILTGLNGAEGLVLLEQHPDTKLIISDFKMPEMNGIEFGVKVKEKYPQIPIFIFTGFAINNQILNGRSTGIIDRYIQKPMNKVELDKAIDEVLNLS